MQPSDILNYFQNPSQQPEPPRQPPNTELVGPQAATEQKPAAPESQSQGARDIESLFRNLAPPLSDNPSANRPAAVNSPPESTISLSSAPASTSDRQAALLSLLGTVGVASAPSTSSKPQQTQQPAATTQAGSPENNQQGKLLLEQLISGPVSSLPAQQPQPQPQSLGQSISQVRPQNQTVAATMPVSHSQPPPATHGQPLNMSSLMTGHSSDREAAEAQRKALFDYVNPYDAFPANPPTAQFNIAQPGPPTQNIQQVAAAAPAAVVSPPKKKPVPVYNPSPQPGTGSVPTSPRAVPAQQTVQRRHTPSPSPDQLNAYPLGAVDISEREEQYAPNRQGSAQNFEVPEDARSNQSQPIGIQHGPLPPIPNQRGSPTPYQRPQVQQPLASPPTRPAHPNPNQSQRQSPPPTQRQHEFTQQQSARGRGSPASLRQGGGQAARDAAGSPSGNSNGSGVVSGGSKRSSKLPAPPNPQGQQAASSQQQPARSSPASHTLITVDVTASHLDTLAAPDAVSITPIALLKLEPTYTPGCTISVASCIAYSMSRGRIRLIGRQTGERALLKLPATFPNNAQVQDMVISGTKLACVSNDGGLVVWDIPGEIEDDAAAVSRIILHVPPQPQGDGFKVAKWHPKQPGVLAVASEKEIFLLNIDEAYQAFGSDGVSQDELARVSKVFATPSPLVSFTFDVPQIALASISIDSTVTLWSIKDRMPFWSGRIHGEGLASSIDFLDGGLVIGRNQGNVIQLVPVMSTTVLSTIRFVMGSGGTQGSKAAVESQDLMFGHLSYDPASKVLWVANSARNSLFAVKMGIENTPVPSQANGANEPAPTIRPVFEQMIEFPCSMPTINLTVVAADSLDDNNSWTRDPSLVVSAFCVHAGGVDQINIGQDAFDESASKATSKLPSVAYDPLPLERPERKGSGQSQSSAMPIPQPQAPPAPQHQQAPMGPPPPQQSLPPAPQHFQQRPDPYQPPTGLYAAPAQQQIPPNMPVYGDQGMLSELNRQPVGLYEPPAGPPVAQQPPQPQGPGKKTKDQANAAGKQSSWKASPSGSAAESVAAKSDSRDNDALAANITKEIRKVEENLATRIGRLISKELDKQQKNLEDVRHADQTADFDRQEKILKLISTELTKNTTRVVESAVKNVIQNSVLPALETVTRAEVKAALNAQISRGLNDSMKQTLPLEIEKLLLRPDVSNHVATTFASAITPLIERDVKDMIHKNLVPAYHDVMTTMQQEIVQDVMGQISQVKKEISAWQGESLKGTHNLIREMDQTIRSLTEQVRSLSVQVSQVNARSPTPRTEPTRPEYPQQQHQRQAPVSAVPSSNSYMPAYSPPQNNGWGTPSMTQTIQQPLGPPPLLAQQTSNVAPPTQAPAPPPLAQTTARVDEWDSTFLMILGQNDPKQIRDLLARSPPDVVLPVGQVSPLSQTVILALIHRLALSLTELSPADDGFKNTLWWLQRCAYSLKPNDNVIAPYISRVLQTAQSTLTTTIQRLNVLPGGPSLGETSTMVGQIQQTLSSLMTS